MSLIKAIKTEVNGKQVSVTLPDSKTVILRGRLSMHILYVVESLLSSDCTGYYADIDSQFGIKYEALDGLSQIMFNNGYLSGRDKCVMAAGVVPNFHCVRYIGNNVHQLRSFLLASDGNLNCLDHDLTKYSSVLADTQWIRMMAIVNDIVGYEMCELKEHKIKFNMDVDSDIDEDTRGLIYILVAECFLTPPNYHRVLLLPDIIGLYPDTQVKLLDSLDNISGHTLTLSTARVQPADIVNSRSVTLLNV